MTGLRGAIIFASICVIVERGRHEARSCTLWKGGFRSAATSNGPQISPQIIPQIYGLHELAADRNPPLHRLRSHDNCYEARNVGIALWRGGFRSAAVCFCHRDSPAGLYYGVFLTDCQFFCFPLRELRGCAGMVKGFIFREIGGRVKRGKSACVSHADNQAVTRSVGNAKNLDVSKLYHNFALKESINRYPP